MAGKILKLASSFLALAFTLSACGSNTDTSILNIPVEQNNKSVSSFATDLPNIIDQIKGNTISQTDWGTHVKMLPNPKQHKKATLLSYLAFDNDKGGYRDELKPTINFHELSGSNTMLNVVLQTDGAEDKDLKRYYSLACRHQGEH